MNCIYFFKNPRRDLRFTVLGQREYLCMNRQSDYTADHLPITNFKGDLSDTLVLGGMGSVRRRQHRALKAVLLLQR